MVVEKPAFWKNGYKVDPDGSVRYKCRYWCECQHKGNHYIYLDEQHVECHECGYHIHVQPAGKLNFDGIPNRDHKGNFFVAHARM